MKKHFQANQGWAKTVWAISVAFLVSLGARAERLTRVSADGSQKGAARLLQRTAPDSLPSQTNSLVLRSLAERWHKLPHEVQHCRTMRAGRPITLAVHHLEPQPDKPALFLTHGLLSDYRTWQLLSADITGSFDVWLVDLPGCGASEAPRPSDMEADAFSPTGIAERVLQAIEQCAPESSNGCKRSITVVGHSLGGTVALRMVSAPELRMRYSGTVSRINHLVLLAPCDFGVNAVPPSFVTLMGLKHWQVSVGDALGIVRPRIQKMTRASYHVAECATIERQGEFAEVLLSGRQLEAAQAMLRQFVPFDAKTLRPQWKQIEPLIADYQNIGCPVLVVYGTWDETLSAAMGNKLKDEIPGALLAKIPGRGHCLTTEEPKICAQLICRFQTGACPSKLAEGLGVSVYGTGLIAGAQGAVFRDAE